MLPKETLVKFVCIGGLACIGISSAYQIQMTNKIRNAEYFREAMKLVNEHKVSDLFLGKPVMTGYVDVFSSKNFADSQSASLYIPLKGSKAKGEMYFSAVKNNVWEVTKVEVELKDRAGGKLLIYDKDKHTAEET